MCDSYDINYITRSTNEGAKAGNINNALKHINGVLFTVLDADMIPRKEFLLKTVGYFVDEQMAFVQVPQVYYNKDVYQYFDDISSLINVDLYNYNFDDNKCRIVVLRHQNPCSIHMTLVVEE